MIFIWTAVLALGSLVTQGAGMYMQNEAMEDRQKSRQKARKERQKFRQKKLEKLESQKERQQQRSAEDQESIARRARAGGRELLLSETEKSNKNESTTDTLG